MSARRKFKPYRFRKVYCRKKGASHKFLLRGGKFSPRASFYDGNISNSMPLGEMIINHMFSMGFLKRKV